MLPGAVVVVVVVVRDVRDSVIEGVLVSSTMILCVVNVVSLSVVTGVKVFVAVDVSVT